MGPSSANLFILSQVLAFGLLLHTVVVSAQARGDNVASTTVMPVRSTTASVRSTTPVVKSDADAQEADEEKDDGMVLCYDCTSVSNATVIEDCLDPFNMTESQIPVVNCTGPLGNDSKEGKDGRGPRCTKSVTTIYDAKAETEYVLISRGCGYSKHNKCSKTVSAAGTFTSCFCDEDHCNGVPSHLLSGTAGALTLLSLLYLYN